MKPFFDQKFIQTHQIPEWRFELLAFFGLAKKVTSVEKVGGTWKGIEGYWVAGTLYVTREWL